MKDHSATSQEESAGMRQGNCQKGSATDRAERWARGAEGCFRMKHSNPTHLVPRASTEQLAESAFIVNENLDA
eukprot:4802103-Pleurochrysis_carterae.AAC.3